MERMKAVRIHGYGGPEVLKYEEAPRQKPGTGEVLNLWRRRYGAGSLASAHTRSACRPL